MKIKNKILVYISSTVTIIILISFVLIYILFAGYREEEFQQQQNEKIRTTLKLIEQFKAQSAEISFLLDEQDIYDFYDEKLMVFNDKKELIFSSLDNLEIQQTEEVLANLSPTNSWIETKEGKHDLIGVYKVRNDKGYYALSKAYDAHGHTKLDFLMKTLIINFIIIVLIVFFISIYIANTISHPIIELESKIYKYNIAQENNPPIEIATTTVELNNLTSKFNDLLKHSNETFKFQKHTIDHISHQLKTPIAVLVSELEKIQELAQDEKIKSKINRQKIRAKSLGEIINVLLEISKIEAGQKVNISHERLDELVYDCIEEMQNINPDFQFNINYSPADIEEEKLTTALIPPLLRQAFMNLISNCIKYASDNQADILFESLKNNQLHIYFSNKGEGISPKEEKYLFKHFFRGINSTGKPGSGLGLFLTKRILELHNAQIEYQRKENNNTFIVKLKL